MQLAKFTHSAACTDDNAFFIGESYFDSKHFQAKTNIQSLSYHIKVKLISNEDTTTMLPSLFRFISILRISLTGVIISKNLLLKVKENFIFH